MRYKSPSSIIKLIFQAVKGGNEEDFTSGSLNKAIFLLSVPMILEMIMESLFAVVDVFFVSQISVNAIATVGLTESVMFIIYSVAIGLSMATTAMVSRRIGEKKPKEAADVAVQALILALTVGLSLGITGLIFSTDILRLMGAEEVLISEGSGYTRIIFAGNVIIMFLFLINAIFRGAGNAATAMRALWIANGLNMILDPLLIFGLGPIPAMGIEGAAIATTTGRGIGVIFQLYVLFGGKTRIKFYWTEFKPKLAIIKRLLSISIGGVGQFLIESASWILLIKLISRYGPEALAGYTIAVRIIIFTLLPSWGISNAAATLVGQNLGAGKLDRAERSVWRTAYINLSLLIVISIVFFLAAPWLISLFNENIAVVDYGTKTLKIVCLGYVFFAFGMVLSQAFNGAGDTKTPTLINFFSFWVFQIPLAYLLAIYFELEVIGVVTAIAIAHSFHAIICMWFFKRGKWKEMKV